MSIRALDTVFRSQLDDQSDVLILLALADWADDDGACYPSMQAISKKARLSDRTVQKRLSDLEEAGLVTRFVRVGRGRSNLYRLHLDRIAAWEPPQKPSDETPSPPVAVEKPEAASGYSSPETPKLTTENPEAENINPEADDRNPEAALRGNPKNPHLEPSFDPTPPTPPQTRGFESGGWERIFDSGLGRVLAPAPTVAESDPPLGRELVWRVLMAMGMFEHVARTLVAEHSDTAILRQVAHLEFLLRRGDRVRKPPGRLTVMLRQGWELPEGADRLYRQIFQAEAGDPSSGQPRRARRPQAIGEVLASRRPPPEDRDDFAERYAEITNLLGEEQLRELLERATASLSDHERWVIERFGDGPVVDDLIQRKAVELYEHGPAESVSEAARPPPGR